MWIVFDLLALIGAYTVCAWIVRNVWGTDGEKELPYQPPIVLHELNGCERATPVKPVEVKAKRQTRKRKP